MSKGFGTTGVAFATAPVVVSTFVQHFVKWPARHKRARNAESTLDGPTSAATLQAQQLRYEEGLNLVRRFLEYASLHGVEEVQAFTAQPLPIPRKYSEIPRDVHLASVPRRRCRLESHATNLQTGFIVRSLSSLRM